MPQDVSRSASSPLCAERPGSRFLGKLSCSEGCQADQLLFASSLEAPAASYKSLQARSIEKIAQGKRVASAKVRPIVPAVDGTDTSQLRCWVVAR